MSPNVPAPFTPLVYSQVVRAGRMWNEHATTADIARALGVHEAAVERHIDHIKRAAKRARAA